MKAKPVRKAQRKTVRRSIALPRKLIEEVASVAPPELSQNLNRMVTVALQEFAAKRRMAAFAEAMAQMAADAAIRSECGAVEKEFFLAEADGLTRD